MTDEVLEGYKFAADNAKQLIAVSTGVITLALGFANLSKDAKSPRTVTALAVAASGFLLSILCGLLELHAIAGHLGRASDAGIYAANIRLFGGLQLLTFLVAVSLTVVYGITSMREGNVTSRDGASPNDAVDYPKTG